MTGVGLIGTYLQSRKKNEKEEDLLGSVEENSLSDIILSDDVVIKQGVNDYGLTLKKMD